MSFVINSGRNTSVSTSPLHRLTVSFPCGFSRQRRRRLPGPGPAGRQSRAQVQPGIRGGHDSRRSAGPAGQHPQRRLRKVRENRMAEGDAAAGVDASERRV